MRLNKFLGLGLLLAVLSIFAGCSDYNTLNDDNNRNNVLNPNNENGLQEDIGFVRYTKDELAIDSNRIPVVKINRPEMANAITRMILENENFEEVATLVTSAEVLIAYEFNEEGDLDRYEAADMARKTALSLMPRYYEVYVSDDKTLINNIETINYTSEKDADTDYMDTIEELKKEMEKSPQGKGESMSVE